jgi:hypothetical protein
MGVTSLKYLCEVTVLIILTLRQLYSVERNKQIVCCFIGASRILPILFSQSDFKLVCTPAVQVFFSCIFVVSLFLV